MSHTIRTIEHRFVDGTHRLNNDASEFYLNYTNTIYCKLDIKHIITLTHTHTQKEYALNEMSNETEEDA